MAQQPKFLQSIPPRAPAKIDALERACRERLPLAMAVLDEIMCDPSTPKPLRVECVRLLQDRGYGKPTIRIEERPVELTTDLSAPIIEHIRDAERAADLTNQVNHWSRLQIPFDQWPEDVQRHSGFMNGADD